MSCSPSDRSYIYWNENGETSPISIKNTQNSPSAQWVMGGLAADYTGMLGLGSQSHGYNNIVLEQVSGESYDGYLRYGDPVIAKWGPNSMGFVALVGGLGWKSPDQGQSPGFFQSQSKGTGSPVLYGDTQAWAAAKSPVTFVGSPSGDPITSPGGNSVIGVEPYGTDSPLYAFQIQDSSWGTPTQQYYSCCGTSCKYSSSPSGVSCSDCQSACGQTGSAVGGNSNTYVPLGGVSSLPVAGCGGQVAKHTYTVYAGQVNQLWLLFLLGTTSDSVTTSAPSKVKDPHYPSSNGYLLFSYDGSDGSASLSPVSTNGPQVSWDANSTWQKWGTGCGSKEIQVTLSLTGITFDLGGSSQSVDFMQTGYANGLYCNLYAAQADADDGTMLAVSGTTGDLLGEEEAKPLAPDWWWYGLLVAGGLVLLMLLVLAMTTNK